MTVTVTVLDSVRVTDLSVGIAGPYCSKLFADAGAYVTRVEQPGGDWLRSYVPPGADNHGDQGALFRFLNGAKHVVRSEEGGAVGALLATSDLIIVDPSTEQDVAGALVDRPSAVVVSVSPFGATGPLAGRPASELVLQAESGTLKFKGRPDRPPVQAGGWIGHYLTGAAAAAPALAAVRKARRTGVGERIDIAVLDVLAVGGSNFSYLLYDLLGRPEPRNVLRYVESPGIEHTADGLIAFNTNSGQMFQNFLLLIGRPDLIGDETFSQIRSRLARLEEWQALIDRCVGQVPTDELVQLATELRVAVARVHDGASVLGDEQFVARGVFVRDEATGVLGPRPPYQLRHPPVTSPMPDAPVLPAAGISGLPLQGLRVIDLTSWWVGAAATQTLAFLGAEVIHVESTTHPDGMRLTGGRSDVADWWERGHMFLAANTNKLGVTLDLDRHEGRAVFLDLVARSHLLVENFSPRVADRWQLTEADVLRLNPRIVYMRMPAFGLSGPWRDRPAFAQTIEPMSTMASVTGYRDEPPLSKGGLADVVAGAHGAWAALLGLWDSERTRRGVAVEATMVEAALNVAAQAVVEFDAYGAVASRHGNRHPVFAPQGVYPASGDDQWVAITVESDITWTALREVIAAPNWANASDLATVAGRRARHDELDGLIAEWTRRRPAEEAVACLNHVGIAAGVCWDPRDVTRHPQLAHRHLFETVQHRVVGDHLVPGAPYRFASVERWAMKAAPTLGEDNDRVLAGILGLSAEQLADLEVRHVIGTRPPGC